MPLSASGIDDRLTQSLAVLRETAEVCTDAILNASAIIGTAFRRGGKLLLCGNGGSAADCQHVAAEFTSRLTADFVRPGLPAIALTTDTSFLTAYANDFGFDGVFSRQVEAFGKLGEVLMAISTSGNSPNVIRAVDRAKSIGPRVGGELRVESRGIEETALREELRMKTIGLTGGTGGRLKELADVCVCIPSDNTQHIQEAHIAVLHVICHLVERALFETEMKKSE